MSSELDYTIQEVGRSEVAVRKDLVFSPRTAAGDIYYLVEDRVNSRFYRLGLAEYTFVSLLDGKTPIVEALRLTSQAIPDHSLSLNDAAAICQWLIDSDLAHTPRCAQGRRLADQAQLAHRRAAAGRWNPLVIKLPLACPERLLESIHRWLAWCHSPPAIAGWFILLAAALWQVASNWPRVVASSAGILAPQNWWLLLVSWFLLKLVHETAHAVVCRKYGGVVREAGVILVLFAPLAYVDVTSSWRFASKWQRIHTAAAGMYAELFVAAVAVFCWRFTHSGTLQVQAFNIMVMASVTTLLFNANPLMKFDGYYILADLLELPNLYVNGQQYLRYWARRWLLGLDVSRPYWMTRRGAWLVRAYGVVAAIWRVVICTCIVLAASTMFHGAGIVLAVAAVVAWFAAPAVAIARYLVRGAPGERPDKARCAIVVALAGGVLWALFAIVPWPGSVRAPGIIELAPYTSVRAGSAGFVQQVLVRDRQPVKQGQTLIVLRNDELAVQLAELKLAIEQSRVQSRSLRKQGRLADYQAQLKKRESLESQLREKQEQVDQLIVRSPRDGRVFGRHLSNLWGTYVPLGTEVLGVGSDHLKELQVSVSQDDLDVFTGRVGQEMRIRLEDSSTLTGRLTEVTPRASIEPTHPALIAPAGGPLAVTKKSELRGGSPSAGQSYQLLAPRFQGTLALSADVSGRLLAGQRGTAIYRPYQQTVGMHMYHQLVRWTRSRLQHLTEEEHSASSSA